MRPGMLICIYNTQKSKDGFSSKTSEVVWIFSARQATTTPMITSPLKEFNQFSASGGIGGSG